MLSNDRGAKPAAILVIDDDESIRKYMERVLVYEGYTVVLASDGREGIEILKKVKPDLILLDMNMPGMTGLEFLKEVRAHRISSVPVLILSGTSDIDLIIESYGLGVYDFIKKPEHTGVMLKRVDNGLKIGTILKFNEYMKTELGMARHLQKNLFPPGRLENAHFRLTAWNIPLTDIGGDLYDYVLFRDGRLIFIVADVSGHSISAALSISIVKLIFRNALKETDDPGKIMSFMNCQLGENLATGSFVTMFCGLFDPATGELTYANAGHPGPIVIRDKEWFFLDSAGPFLGPITGTEYASNRENLRARDRLVLYSDGIPDWYDLNKSTTGKCFIAQSLTDFPMDGTDNDPIHKKIMEKDRAMIDDCTLLVLDIQ